MDAIIIASLWVAGVVACVHYGIWKSGKLVDKWIELSRTDQEFARQEAEVALIERRNQALLGQATVADRAALEQAQLKQEAAEADARAEITRATVPDRIAAEQQVVAARTERRVLAIKNRAVQGGDDAAMKALMDAYIEYRRTGGQYCIEDWLGDLRLVDGELVSADEDEADDQ